jgi:hypothetical protein
MTMIGWFCEGACACALTVMPTALLAWGERPFQQIGFIGTHPSPQKKRIATRTLDPLKTTIEGPFVTLVQCSMSAFAFWSKAGSVPVELIDEETAEVVNLLMTLPCPERPAVMAFLDAPFVDDVVKATNLSGESFWSFERLSEERLLAFSADVFVQHVRDELPQQLYKLWPAALNELCDGFVESCGKWPISAGGIKSMIVADPGYASAEAFLSVHGRMFDGWVAMWGDDGLLLSAVGTETIVSVTEVMYSGEGVTIPFASVGCAGEARPRSVREVVG